MVDYTRTLFALHKSGYLVPVLLSIKETTSEDGSPEFVGIMRGLHLSEEFILLTDTFSIIGCTMRSLSVLQLEGSSVASNDLSLLEWAPEIPVCVIPPIYPLTAITGHNYIVRAGTDE